MWHIVAKQGNGITGIYLWGYANEKVPNNSNWSYSVDVKGTGKILELGIEGSNKNPVVGTISSEWSRISQTGNFDNDVVKTIVMYFSSNDNPIDVYIKLPKLELGNIPTDWTPAPEDKVNVSDMRKPASDVVGLEDVPNGLYKGSLAQNTDLNTLTQEGIYNFSGESFVNFIDSDIHWGTIQIINKSAMVTQLVICTSNIRDQIFFRTQSGAPATWLPWTMVPRFSTDNSLVLPNGELITPADDSKVVHITDTSNWQKQAMFNPGDFKIDVTSPTTDFATLLRTKYDKGGIVYIRDSNGPSYAEVVDAVVICEGGGWWYAYGVTIDGNFVHRRIRASDDTGWIINADDSKVAHLSGANNFNTVPTYGTGNKPFAINDTGATTARPTGQTAGYQYFDTSLNKPIWYTGKNWVDATGTTV
ncbi:PblB protein [Secundilactobacillus pentosiphilus]|uniref:PblB protein n=1 Tax=Secundilactobacillus pentosiphilus TaxID=1714682 RepID=A0A1Z5ISI1_9LACO|nr:pyocin knob domain-containing protein [Secundilactobacillus pentosiphilus]GAX04699.1 PblB protein [Secundilactobacillus pentosiphilus]